MQVALIDHPYAMELRISVPERRNALGFALGLDILSALESVKMRLDSVRDFEAVPRPERCLLLTAARSHQTWLSGGDLKELETFAHAEAARPYIATYQKIVLMLESLPIPVLALVDGDVLGGGIEFILGASWRLASESSRFLFKQGAVGLLPGYGGLLRLKESIGSAHAQRLLACAASVTAREALSMGLIQHLSVNSDSLLEDALDYAESLSRVPFQIVALQKMMLTRARDPARLEELGQEQELFLSQWRNPFHEAFLAGFKAGKAPRG